MIVHDENNAAVIGDKVLIEAAGRRLSKKKTFVIKDIVKKSSFEKEFYDHLNSQGCTKRPREVRVFLSFIVFVVSQELYIYP